MQAAVEAGVLDLEAVVHHHLQTGRLGTLRHGHVEQVRETRPIRPSVRVKKECPASG